MLYSTKRKWEKLILSNATPSRASTPASAEPPTPTLEPKRSRLESMYKSTVRAVSPTASLGTNITTHTEPSAPAFVPWDRDAFLARLATFRFVDKWQAKPTAVNEVAWARRGWVCSDKNRVRCNMCRNEVLVGLEPDDELTENGRALVQKYEEMVVGEHEDGCLWKQRGCDDTIYRIHLANPAIARPAFSKRYQSLVRIRAEIPPALSYPGEVDQAKLFYPSECSEDAPISEAAAILAMFGWQNDEPGVPSLVTCSACFRRLGLWLFQKRGEEANGEASVCRLDVVGEHRDYCPWINAQSQGGAEPGWQMLMKMLRYPPKGQSTTAGSIYSVSSQAPTEVSEMSAKDQATSDDSKLKRLKTLKKMYFGTMGKKDRIKTRLEVRSREKEAKNAPAETTAKESGEGQEKPAEA